MTEQLPLLLENKNLTDVPDTTVQTTSTGMLADAMSLFNRPNLHSVKEAKKNIERRFQSLPITSITFGSEGANNTTFVVNNDYVFRFPKWPRASAVLQREVRAIPFLQPHVQTPFPEYPYFSAPSKTDPYALGGCRLFRGQQLSPHVIKEMQENDRKTLIANIARFLREVHAVPHTSAVQGGLYVHDDRQFYTQFAEEYFPRHIFPHLSATQRQTTMNFFADYLSNPRNFTENPVPLFGDVKLDAFFLRPGTPDIEGVIDPEPMIGDTSIDFFRLEYELSKQDFERLLGEYGHPDPETCHRQIDFGKFCRFARKTQFFRQNEDHAGAETMLRQLRERLDAMDV